MLIVSFITNLNKRYVAITKAFSVFIIIQNVYSATIVHVKVQAEADSLAEMLSIRDFKANRG